MLASIRHSAIAAPNAPVLVIAHGLYGSGRNWGVIARRLADHRDVVAVDMRNHGESPRFPTQSYPDMAADLAVVIEGLGPQPVDLLGHSMGGKAAMQLALTRPDLIRRLIVADIAPVPYTHDQTRNAQAMAALDLTQITTRAEADAALARHIDDAALRAFFLQSLDFRTKPPHWKLNLSVLEAEMPKIVGWPDTQGQFPNPTLFLTGAQSSYVRPEHRNSIKALFPKARFAKIPDAGHWLHAEKPREFEETVRVFLDA
jgi:esterase